MFHAAIGQRHNAVRWHPPGEGNLVVVVSKCPHGYRGQQDEKGRSLRGQMSTRVGKGLIGGRSQRGIEWYRACSVPMAREVSRMKKADISPGTSRCPPESDWASLQSSRVLQGLLAIR